MGIHSMSILSLMMASRRGVLFCSTLVIWTSTASAQGTLPYIPTTILPFSDSWAYENHTNRGLYIFSPTDTSVDLLFINTSSTLKASSLKPKTLTTGLPFVDTQSRTSAFAPSIADDGTLTVFAGDCAVPGSEAIWIYGQMASTSSGPGWMKHAASQGVTSSTSTPPGAPYLLGGSMSFSSTIGPDTSPPVTYLYGGMCPWTNTTSTATWQSAATYSNRMLKVSQHQSREGTIYTTETTTTTAAGGPPRAEAGFTFTALTPALSNRSGTVTQEISHVLLGGHTEGAFINMSTAAVWNLPEETWNIVYINPPPTDENSYGGANTELLAIKATAGAGSVESRSGHTAVLNEDGTALVVFGGWVGDLSQAASPQLVILEMGGSLAEWRWSIPKLQPSGPGIYGHGAVLLPGNVMMVYGGYATTTSTTAKRAATRQQMFLNLTTLTWSDEYTNPTPPSSTTVIPGGSTSTAPSTSSSNSSATSSSTPSKLGLGLGLGLGIPLLGLLIAAILFLRRRRRLNRLRRDEIVRDLSQDAGRFLSADDDDPDGGEMTEADAFSAAWFPAGSSWNATAAQDWYTGGGDAYQRGSRSLGYETLRGRNNNGMSGVPVPMPPSSAAAMAGGGQGQGNGMLGRSRSAARGLYLPSTTVGNAGYEFGNGGAGKGGIHPTIYEAEDEDGEVTAAAATAQRSTSVSPEHSSEGGESDPFVTPATTPRGHGPAGGGVYLPAPHSNRSSATPSPEHPHRSSRTYQGQDAEVQEWVSDIDAADAVLTARIGPHGGTTTTVTPLGMQQVTPPKQTGRPGGKSRRNSFIEGGAEEARTGSNLSESARSTFSFARGDSVRIVARGEGGSTTAVAAVTAEGVKRTGSSSGSSSHTYNTAKTHAGNNSNFANLREEGPSLLLGSASRGYSPEHINDDDNSPPGSPSKHKPRRSWLGSLRRVFSGSITETSSSSSRGGGAESPTHGGSGSDYEPRLVGMGPGGRLLRRKQGREAWAAGEEREEEDEWDVERAVEQRLVQIMFTVPKERLRVVNAEVEEEEVGEIVDPERERLYGDDADDREFRGGGRRYRREEVVGSSSRDEEKMALRRQEVVVEEEEGYRERRPLRLESDIADEQHYTGEDEEKMALRREDRESRRSESTVRETRLEVPPPEQERRPSTPMTPTTFHTAEMVKMERPPKPKVLQTIDSIESLERPKTKVLQMVESIESLSREGSPATSPAKKK